MLVSNTNDKQIYQNSNIGFVFDSSLDQTFLKENYCQNLAFAKKMFTIFLEGMPHDIKNLSIAVQESNFPKIVSIAHKVKNNFTWVGLPELKIKMNEIESIAKISGSQIGVLHQHMMTLYESSIQIIRKENHRLSEYLN